MGYGTSSHAVVKMGPGCAANSQHYRGEITGYKLGHLRCALRVTANGKDVRVSSWDTKVDTVNGENKREEEELLKAANYRIARK